MPLKIPCILLLVYSQAEIESQTLMNIYGKVGNAISSFAQASSKDAKRGILLLIDGRVLFPITIPNRIAAFPVHYMDELKIDNGT